MSLDGIKKPPRNSAKQFSQNQSFRQSAQPKQSTSHSLQYDPTEIKKRYQFNKNKDLSPITSKNHLSGKSILKFFGYLFLILFLSALVVTVYFVWKIDNFSSKITGVSSDNSTPSFFKTISDLSKKRQPLKGETSGRINILLLGVAGKGKAGGLLTDTIMIASIDTRQGKVALLSIPRDLYVKIPNTDYHAKINALYEYGLSHHKGLKPLKQIIEDITSLKINYYLVVNFSGFEKFIDSLGGINIQVKRDIYDPHYPGPNYSYETFEIKKGLHKMNGATALKYARERHNDPDGDFGRAKRQQQVLQAVKNKIFSSQTIFNPFKLNSLLNTLGNNIKTDASLPEIRSFLELSKQLDTQNINTVVVDAWKSDSLLKVSHIFYKNYRAFILVPRIGNYSEIRDLAQNIFNLNEIKRRQEEIKKENPRIALINAGKDYSLAKKVRRVLQKKLNFANVKIEKSENLSRQKQQTEIFDLTAGEKPFSLDELTKKIPAKLSATDELKKYSSLSSNKNDYDFIVVLGNDIVNAYSYQEATMQDLINNQNHNFDLIISK